MPACKPLDRQEISAILKTFTGRFAVRDAALLVFGVLTGYRIAEILSLRVRDVVLRGRVRDAVVLGRNRVKGRRAARSIFLTPEAQQCVSAVLDLLERQGRLHKDAPLFQGRKNRGRALSRGYCSQILRAAADQANVRGQIGTHSMRKTFAGGIYHELCLQQQSGAKIDPLVLTSRALGHKSIQATSDYLPAPEQHIKDALFSLSNIIDSELLTQKLASKTRQKNAQF